MKGVSDMDKMIATLEQIGVPLAECRRIRKAYRNDPDGLAMYVLYMRAVLDDRREYVS